MRPSLALAGLALVAAGLPLTSAVTSAATSAANNEGTCQEKPVTISDADGGYVEGTDGDDVIRASSTGHSTIDAMGGNDTICFRNGVVRAGLGHDSVEMRPEWADATILDAEDLDVSGRTDGGPTYLRLQDVGRGGGSVRLGDGDTIELVGQDLVFVDLDDDLMRLDGGTYSVVGEPGLYAVARRVLLTGDASRNRLHIHQRTCKAAIEGGRGHDVLTMVSEFLGFEPFSLPRDCGRRKSEIYGNRGNDRLQGGRFDDLLVGGRGRDGALGGPGTNTCQAEIEKKCQR